MSQIRSKGKVAARCARILRENKREGLLHKWRALARRAGTFQARVFLTLFYWIVMVPVGLVVRLLADPLALKDPEGGRWTPTAPTRPEGQG